MTGVRAESACQTRLGRQIDHLAAERWSGKKPTVLIGRADSLVAALEKVARFATSDCPVLITGETGTGKELFARALYLLGERRHRQFLSINCAQYHDGQLIASELFGHRRGSFTGAIADHRGMFEEADGGVLFLDEVGELSLPAQAMLLRVLGDGEIVPVGGTQARSIDVRVLAATSRDLLPMVEAGTFRPDLYYRLRYLHVAVPPVRDRGNDWELIAGYYLELLARKRGLEKRFSDEAKSLMRSYEWPGNVREVKSVVDTGFHLSSGTMIEARDFAEQLESVARARQLRAVPLTRVGPVGIDPLSRMIDGGETFWVVVHQPYLARELSRTEARFVVERGLDRTRGSYKRLLRLFNVAADDYLKFMDFLRHQRLKPEQPHTLSHEYARPI
jgi:transcriptional regulator with GAF, ATPase, and Fis domain